MERVPEVTSLLQQVLSLAKEGHPLFTATSMVEGEMDNAGWLGFFCNLLGTSE